ncbi:MAG: hypothetical protein B7Z80_04350 [Rhodospirillales bacterium 20-64-7]|nr:MAG: hypothetical protein B7Z80_04350 [Rhodospirillales bacterium 20-64-7]HQT79869.1 SAM-dependent methyltransferase [Rhodopila sp.]
MTESRPADHFRRLYEATDDPWGFTTSPYEQAKYRHTVDALAGRRFAAGLEVGCSIGVLTRLLAEQCDTLLGVDIVEDPLPAARARCADQPWVRFQRMRVPLEWPQGRFDLIVLSEVLYFLASADIDLCARQALASLLPNAVIVLVNWLGQSDDPTTGHEAAERFIAASGLPVLHQAQTSGYRLDLLSGLPA